MSVWYAFLNALGIRMFEMDFMKNALLAVLLLGPLFGLLSTMIVTGKMSFFSDALGHSGFTGIAIGVLCGAVQPIYFAVGLSVLFALLFSFVRSRTSQSADTIIGVFSSTAVALGIFIVTLGGRSFTKFNRYLIGDILSVSPQEIGLLALVLLAVVLLWVFGSNRLVLTAVHPQLASSRGVATKRNETLFTVAIAIVVTLAMSWVGLMVINSLGSSCRRQPRAIWRGTCGSTICCLSCPRLCAGFWAYARHIGSAARRVRRSRCCWRCILPCPSPCGTALPEKTTKIYRNPTRIPVFLLLVCRKKV